MTSYRSCEMWAYPTWRMYTVKGEKHRKCHCAEGFAFCGNDNKVLYLESNLYSSSNGSKIILHDHEIEPKDPCQLSIYKMHCGKIFKSRTEKKTSLAMLTAASYVKCNVMCVYFLCDVNCVCVMLCADVHAPPIFCVLRQATDMYAYVWKVSCCLCTHPFGSSFGPSVGSIR